MRVNAYLRSHKTKRGETRRTIILREQGHPERYINLGPVSKKTAEERRIAVLSEVLSGTYKSKPTVDALLSDFIQKFMEDFATGSRSAKTLDNYRYDLNTFARAFPNYRLSQVTQQEIEKYFAGVKTAGRTKNILLSTLRLLFSKAVEWNYLGISPMTGIKRFKENCQGSRALTTQELQKVWGEGRLTAWQKSVAKLMIYSGMRPGELSQLKFQDVDLEKNTLWIISDKERQTKSRKTRYVPINEDLREELLFLRDFLPAKGGNSPHSFHLREAHQRVYILCHEDGSQIKSFRYSVARALRSRGILGVSPHGLRKTFCSELARQKVHPKVAQTLMGHSDISLTMRVYTEIDDEQLREAIKTLPSSSRQGRYAHE